MTIVYTWSSWSRLKEVVKGNKKRLTNAVIGGTALLALSAAGAYWKSTQPVPAYTVARVIDGDTFVTTEGQYIRLANIEAPDLDLCGGQEAKASLGKLTKGKPVYVKVLYRDKYSRLESLVYTPEIFVNEKMLENGNSYYRIKFEKSPETKKLELAQEKAKNKNAGIFGPECTQEKNPDNAKCVIKGNVNESTGLKQYSLPGCRYYDQTVIQKYLGDQWFCAESEAQKAGFVKAGGCE